MFSILIALVVVLVLAGVCDGRLRKYEDTLCLLTGQPSRDKAEMKHFATVGTQKVSER